MKYQVGTFKCGDIVKVLYNSDTSPWIVLVVSVDMFDYQALHLKVSEHSYFSQYKTGQVSNFGLSDNCCKCELLNAS